jgi:hypothetical protein
MKVITNTGEYATVTKVMSNHFEIRCDNGVTKLIEKHRCEELVPISKLKEAKKNVIKATEQTMRLAVEMNKLHTLLQDELQELENAKTPHAEGWRQCANKVIIFLTNNLK